MGLYQFIMPVCPVILSLTALGLTAAVSNLTSQQNKKKKAASPPLCATMTIRNRITNRGLEDKSHEDQKSSSA